MPVTHVFFDYGGVIAEEGFLHGLFAIAAQEGRDPHAFFQAVRDIVFAEGYVTGRIGETDFWTLVRERLGVRRSGDELRREILERFRLRPVMLALVRALRARGVRAALLSDQTNWLDELDARDGFFGEFDHVFNSFHYGRHKGQREFFEIALRAMTAVPGASLFVDDAAHNVRTAREAGMAAIHFTGPADFAGTFAAYFPDIPFPSGRDGPAGRAAAQEDRAV